MTKKRYFSLALLSILIVGQIGYAQVGIGTTTINDGTALQIDSSNSGVLIPRFALSSRTVQSPVSGTLTDGLMIYNTAIAGTFPNNVVPGFYYWKNNKWNPIAESDIDKTVKYSNANTSDNFSTTGGINVQVYGTEGWNEDTSLYQYVSPTEMRVLRTGYYEVTCNLSLNSANRERYLELRLRLNSTDTGDRIYGLAPEDSGNGGDFSIHFTQTIQINANDILRLRSYRVGSSTTISFKDAGTSSITIKKIR